MKAAVLAGPASEDLERRLEVWEKRFHHAIDIAHHGWELHERFPGIEKMVRGWLGSALHKLSRFFQRAWAWVTPIVFSPVFMKATAAVVVVVVVVLVASK